MSAFKAGVSGGGLILADKLYNDRVDIMGSNELKRAALQGALSLYSNSLESMVRPYLPAEAQVASNLLKPVIIGAGFSLACKYVLKDRGSLGYNFVASGAAELASNSLSGGMGCGSIRASPPPIAYLPPPPRGSAYY